METTLLQPGQLAPNFNLPGTLQATSQATPIEAHQKISLHDFRGMPVVLIFYPGDWNPICGDQLALYNEILPTFKEHRARLLGISVDSVWSHLAFSKNNNLYYPLLSDFEPKGSVAKSYGVYDPLQGTSSRALFVVNPQGQIHWSCLFSAGINPGADRLLEALELIPKQLCRSPFIAETGTEVVHATLS